MLPSPIFIGNKSRVPHVSLVFREMWDNTASTRKRQLTINS
jgi:hypothetical protein